MQPMVAEQIRTTTNRLQFEDPELELAVCCSRTTPDPATAERIRELVTGEIDWGLALEIASRHRVTPLVHRKLLSIAPEVFNCPGGVTIARQARVVAARSLRLTGELLRLVAAFEAKGISPIPIKGPLLALSSVGDVAGREFDDLDILVRPRELPVARAVLVSLGYTPEHVLDREQEAAFIRSEHAFRYMRRRDQMVVELHWRLQDRYLSFPFDTEELWNRAVTVSLFGKKVRCLTLEDTILFLCMHGAKHYWERLEWIACLPALLKANPAIQWPVVLKRAEQLGGIRILYLGLLLAHELDPCSGAEGPLSGLKPEPLADELAARVWKMMGADEITGSLREVYRYRFYLKARERLRDRLRVVRFASIRIPHPDSSVWEHVALSNGLLFLHYLLSPIRLLRKFGLQGLRGVVKPARIP
jgi:Uncharacterised nucleotidyltransferase